MTIPDGSHRYNGLILPNPHRYRNNSGWELRKFSSGYMYKKEEYTISPPPPPQCSYFSQIFLLNFYCSKVSKALFFINRIKNFIHQKSLTSLYYAMIHSHLNYCLNVYGCANTTNLQRLRLKQKEAIRVFCHAVDTEITLSLYLNN